MSLYCAVGSVDTDLTPRQLNDLLAPSLANSVSAAACLPCRPIRPVSTPAPAN